MEFTNVYRPRTPVSDYTLSGDSTAPLPTHAHARMWSQLKQVIADFHDDVLLDWSRSGSGTGRHVDFGDGPKPDLKVVERLGETNNTVVEVECHGTRLAKKLYNVGKMSSRRERDVIDLRKEIEMLRRLRHRHVIELVGSFSHGSPEKLELLFWPVAPCSFAEFLEAVDAVAGRVGSARTLDPAAAQYGETADSLDLLRKVVQPP